MKKSIFLSFVLAAGFVATFLSGCGDDGPISGCNEINGRDTGSHLVYLADVNPGLAPINDTLDATVTGSTVSISSKALGRTLTGTVDASDCNKVNLDSVIFAPGDTLFISSTTFGLVKIWGIRAGGTGTISASGSTTRINISKGFTNITALGGVLSDLNGKNANLRGTFVNR